MKTNISGNIAQDRDDEAACYRAETHEVYHTTGGAVLEVGALTQQYGVVVEKLKLIFLHFTSPHPLENRHCVNRTTSRRSDFLLRW